MTDERDNAMLWWEAQEYEHLMDKKYEDAVPDDVDFDSKEGIEAMYEEYLEMENAWPKCVLYASETETLDVPDEVFDFLKVFAMGAKKHGANNWLDKDGKKCSHKEMHDSMFHHLASSYANTRTDPESGLDHLLHLAARAVMYYVRQARGLND